MDKWHSTSAFVTNEDVGLLMGVQPDNKILSAGYETIVNKENPALARFNPNGNLDSSFGINGKTSIIFSTGNDGATGVQVQVDNKIIISATAGVS